MFVYDKILVYNKTLYSHAKSWNTIAVKSIRQIGGDHVR